MPSISERPAVREQPPHHADTFSRRQCSQDCQLHIVAYIADISVLHQRGANAGSGRPITGSLSSRPVGRRPQRRLRRRESCDRHAERAARHVIQPDLLAERD